MTDRYYPIGTPGTPWGPAEVAAWRSKQVRHRSYAGEVQTRIEALQQTFEVSHYGQLDYAPEHYPLFAVKSRDWDPARPLAIVTGGVHGYETSGVMGALLFLERHAAGYQGRVNLLVVPCVSPWGFERIHRWNPEALDPNRNFRAGSPAQESAALWALLAPLADTVRLHIDLHETTDTDESEFSPALAARDGKPFEPGVIPDGFYLCADAARPEPAFQQAVIAEVAKVTHIAPADQKGQIIGSPVVAPGVIEYPCRELGLCAGITNAPYRTTTEVYPDSPRATPDQCNEAQVAAIRAALEAAC
ncbi:MAG: M14 family metallocarboxypeptidase [Acidobacteria bacterium]|nr:M14 family metallocarboxypeptidase [Acidobacteriota bacterium]